MSARLLNRHESSTTLRHSYYAVSVNQTTHATDGVPQ